MSRSWSWWGGLLWTWRSSSSSWGFFGYIDHLWFLLLSGRSQSPGAFTRLLAPAWLQWAAVLVAAMLLHLYAGPGSPECLSRSCSPDWSPAHSRFIHHSLEPSPAFYPINNFSFLIYWSRLPDWEICSYFLDETSLASIITWLVWACQQLCPYMPLRIIAVLSDSFCNRSLWTSLPSFRFESRLFTARSTWLLIVIVSDFVILLVAFLTRWRYCCCSGPIASEHLHWRCFVPRGRSKPSASCWCSSCSPSWSSCFAFSLVGSEICSLRPCQGALWRQGAGSSHLLLCLAACHYRSRILEYAFTMIGLWPRLIALAQDFAHVVVTRSSLAY